MSRNYEFAWDFLEHMGTHNMFINLWRVYQNVIYEKNSLFIN